MNYLFYGTENFFIDQEIKNILDSLKVDSINVSKYDLETCDIKDIIEDANTVSLFDSNKVIIVENSYIFTKNDKKDKNIVILEEYLKNKNSFTTLIFITNDKIDTTKKIVKLFKENGIIKEFTSPKNINDTIKKLFDDYSISNSTIDLLVKKSGNNIEILYQEIEKLKIYKLDDKVILDKDINDLASTSYNIDIYKFVDSIINKNKKDALRMYKVLLKINEEPIKLIALIASKFRLMYQTLMFTSMGYSEDMISSILKVHKYPVHLALLTASKYNREILLKYLSDLADLDIGIKTGKLDKDNALELFILML